MSVFFHLAKNTFRECLREPVFFMALSAGLILIGFMPAATLFVFQKALWMVLDSALALTLLLGFITAVLCASHCIRREMTNGTALLLLSKPVSRFVFIAAKIAGVDAAMAVFAVIFCSAAVMMSMTTAGMLFFEHWGTFSYFMILALCGLYGAAENYFRHAPFSARAVPALAIAMPLFALTVYFIASAAEPLYDGPAYISLGRLAPALYLVFAALMLIGTISAAFATKFSFQANLIFCLALFFFGLMSAPWLRSVFGADSAVGALLGAVIPNWQLFWMSSALSSGASIPVRYLLAVTAYVILYCAVCMLWAAAFFQNTEPAKDSRI